MWVSHGFGPPQVRVDIFPKASPKTWFFFWFRFSHEARSKFVFRPPTRGSVPAFTGPPSKRYGRGVSDAVRTGSIALHSPASHNHATGMDKPRRPSCG